MPHRRAVGRRWRRAVALGDAPLATALEHGMDGQQLVALQDVDLPGQRVHLDDAPAGTIGHRVKIAAEGDHAVAGYPAIERKHGIEGSDRQRLEMRLFFGKVLKDNAAGGGMPAWIGDRIQPLPKLGIEVIKAAEGPAKEEVLAHVAEWPLHLPLVMARYGLQALGRKP